MRAVSFTLGAALMMVSGSFAFAAGSGGSTHGKPSLWRASEFIGVPILDTSHITVGKITDLLIGRNGRAKYVVIGVGSTFGFGEKNVALPFAEIRFTNRAIEPPPNPVTTSSTGAPPGTLGASPAGGFADPAAVLDGKDADRPERSVGHPDHGTIDMTADEIEKAPTFHFKG